MLKFFSQIKRFALDLLLPIECLGCLKEGEYFCDACQKKLSPNSQAESKRLGKNLFRQNIQEFFIAGNYESELLKNLITKYKYHFLSALSVPLGRFLIDFWKKEPFLENNNSLIIIPIPLSKKRFRWRGFNQAELVANVFAKEFSYPVYLDLKRKKHCRPQAELNEKKRRENVCDIFRWRGCSLSGKTIILIDDVATTGATLEAAAGALKEASTEKIYGLVLAKG